MTVDYYDREGRPLADRYAWARLHNDLAYKVLRKTRVGEDIEVSTVWVGINLAPWMREPALIFETMIFGGDHDQDARRYATEQEALAGHDRAVGLATKGGKLPAVDVTQEMIEQLRRKQGGRR